MIHIRVLSESGQVARRRTGAMGLIALACWLTISTGDAAAQPSVRFASSQFAAVEKYTQVQISLVVSGEAESPVVVDVNLAAGTATPGYGEASWTNRCSPPCSQAGRTPSTFTSELTRIPSPRSPRPSC